VGCPERAARSPRGPRAGVGGRADPGGTRPGGFRPDATATGDPDATAIGDPDARASLGGIRSHGRPGQFPAQPAAPGRSGNAPPGAPRRGPARRSGLGWAGRGRHGGRGGRRYRRRHHRGQPRRTCGLTVGTARCHQWPHGRCGGLHPPGRVHRPDRRGSHPERGDDQGGGRQRVRDWVGMGLRQTRPYCHQQPCRGRGRGGREDYRRPLRWHPAPGDHRGAGCLLRPCGRQGRPERSGPPAVGALRRCRRRRPGHRRRGTAWTRVDRDLGHHQRAQPAGDPGQRQGPLLHQRAADRCRDQPGQLGRSAAQPLR
jgi:hypothetical protein